MKGTVANKITNALLVISAYWSLINSLSQENHPTVRLLTRKCLSILKVMAMVPYLPPPEKQLALS